MIETLITKANLIPLFHITVYHYPLKTLRVTKILFLFTVTLLNHALR